jgi:stage IV sporulation protein A
MDVYADMKARTNGEMYIGVVGPVRTGKSTFIKRCMDLFVLPNMTDLPAKERTKDELPQSAAGKTIMTTEPKFIPKDAATLQLGDMEIQVRFVDCVGYMVNGAAGHEENGEARMVKTPWFDYEIPFSKAAEIGTKKVITDHATIGIVLTTDGSFGELKREDFFPGEQQTIEQLKALGKPFTIVLNTARPYGAETKALAKSLEEAYGVGVCIANCEQLKKEDITHIFQSVLAEFPVVKMEFYTPKWIEMLTLEHPVKAEVLKLAKQMLGSCEKMKDVTLPSVAENRYVHEIKIEEKSLSDGIVRVTFLVKEKFYYEMLSDLTGLPISGEYELVKLLKDMAETKQSYSDVAKAMNGVKETGYGIVTPQQNEITLEEPQLIKSGNKYGVKIKATAPSIHFIKTDILTEIAPIVGSEEQAQDMIAFINENAAKDPEGIWDTNIFGKTISQIVEEGIQTKVENLSAATQQKMKDTLQKITNESSRGVICIIL